jgi:hypothetical protein
MTCQHQSTSDLRLQRQPPAGPLLKPENIMMPLSQSSVVTSDITDLAQSLPEPGQTHLMREQQRQQRQQQH